MDMNQQDVKHLDVVVLPDGRMNTVNAARYLGLSEKTLAMIGSKSSLINEPLPEDDPKQRQPDISLAKEKLGWEPVIKLDEGLARTIDYFKSVL